MSHLYGLCIYRDTRQADGNCLLRIGVHAHADIPRRPMARHYRPESMQGSVKLCEYALLDVVAGYKDTAAVLPKGHRSISNYGYTVSVGRARRIHNKAEAQERAQSAPRYLQCRSISCAGGL
jgi:hypothetical protein